MCAGVPSSRAPCRPRLRRGLAAQLRSRGARAYLLGQNGGMPRERHPRAPRHGICCGRGTRAAWPCSTYGLGHRRSDCQYRRKKDVKCLGLSSAFKRLPPYLKSTSPVRRPSLQHARAHESLPDIRRPLGIVLPCIPRQEQGVSAADAQACTAHFRLPIPQPVHPRATHGSSLTIFTEIPRKFMLGHAICNILPSSRPPQSLSNPVN
ncbi:hypothetical protein BC834DRAFT_67008 [Gloeopeniophorella convolvens]|nr:hypothetical protein BC834DRAFT_67008 [Gloeopeniophorella convolvens]